MAIFGFIFDMTTDNNTSSIVLSNDQIEKAKTAFDFFDQDGNGSISREELAEALNKFGQLNTEEDIDTYFDLFDKDKNGSIDLDEFLEVIKHYLQNAVGILAQNDVLKDVFSEEELGFMMQFITIHPFITGEKLQIKGEPAASANLILYGEVEEVDDDATLAIREHGVYGICAFLSVGYHKGEVKAKTDGIRAEFDIGLIEQLTFQNAALSRKIKNAFTNSVGGDIDDAGTVYIALIAHNNMKSALVQFVEKHIDYFDHIPLVATVNTGEALFKKLGISLTKKVASGPLGGDQTIGSMIAPGQLGAVFFFRDPLFSHPHQADIDALTRLCDVYQIPIATNPATAEALVDYLSRNGLNFNTDSTRSSETMKDYKKKQDDVLRKL